MDKLKDSFIHWMMVLMMALLSGVCSYGVSLLGSMSHNIQELNLKVAIILERSADQAVRLDRLERKVFGVDQK